MRVISRGRLAVAAIAGFILQTCAQDLWCGKVYTAGEPEVIPGGWLYAPSVSTSPLLDVQVTPRHSIYVGSEITGEFIVDAGFSSYSGVPYEGTPPESSSLDARNLPDFLDFVISVDGRIVTAGAVAVNTTDNLFTFLLLGLEPRMDAYAVTLTGSTGLGRTPVTATTSLFYLPEKTTGSVVKVDNLYGSLLYRNAFTKGAFEPVFPYGFYGDYSGYFAVNTSTFQDYVSLGFNALNPVTEWDQANLTTSLEAMDANNVLFQYDMRGTYMNASSVAWQVPLVRDHPSLLTYYTADEPDGWEYPLNSTALAYEQLAQLDKYHPVALVLNCQNYYFTEYAAGADVLMEDAYPVGINGTWSYRGTPCNTTYGDCGCDNCVGSLLDVPARIDDFHAYGRWIGGPAARKPVWEVPQSFYGEGYWARDPTASEIWVMDLLAVNHGAKGRMSWIYPPTQTLTDAASRLAKVLTVAPVVSFLTGANPVLVMDSVATSGVDVAFWTLGGQVLVGVVNPNNGTVASFEVDLPSELWGKRIERIPWGDTRWSFDGTTLKSEGGLSALGSSLVILQ